MEIRLFLNGVGAAATAVTGLLITAEVMNVAPCDWSGTIWNGRIKQTKSSKQEIAELTYASLRKKSLADLVIVAAVFIRVSAPGILMT